MPVPRHPRSCRIQRTVALFALLGSGACGGPAAPAARAAPTAPSQGGDPAATADPSGLSGPVVTVRSPRQLVQLPLPAGADWVLDDRGPSWFLAVHPATRSELAARTWRTGRSVKPGECLAEASLRRPRLFTLPEEVLETAGLAAPEGYTGEVVTGVSRVRESLVGRIVAVGRTAGRCFALGYLTEAEGAGAPAVVGARLATVGAVVLPAVRALDTTDRF